MNTSVLPLARVLSAVLVVGAVSLTAPAACAGDKAMARQTLPDNVIPSHYDLALHPDIAALHFTAEVGIDVNVARKLGAITLNARRLEIVSARLEDGRAGTVRLDPALEQATISFAGGVTPGKHRLSIAYRGAIGRGTIGIFAMDTLLPSGTTRRIIATNLEPAAERSLMPSWDEPDRKASFSVTVDVPSSQMAIGNMPIAHEAPLPGGLKRVRFATTPRMSTYLLYLGIGDYERLERVVDGTRVGVVVARGEAERGRFALDEAARLLHYYNSYFGIRFPLPKLDLVVAPGRIQGGSMENWGSILYSQEHLLIDPKSSTEADRQLVFLVVAHEMAHQWFGDLVTMAWWNDLWLNEGFARWMQTKSADDLHPEWHTGLQASWITEQGMRADAKPSTHPVEQAIVSPDEAALAFDEITYDKGASIVSMIETYVGPERFRAGLHRYLAEHAYGTSVSADLWRTLQGTSEKPVAAVARDFTLRPGLPLMSVSTGAGSSMLGQTRFEIGKSAAGEPVQPWLIPVTVGTVGQAPMQRMMDGPRLALPADLKSPLLVDGGRHGYMRVRYDKAAFGALLKMFGSLPPIDQIALIQDNWALGQSAAVPPTDVLDLIAALPGEADPIVWREAVRVMVAIDHVYDGADGQGGYRQWGTATLQPVLARVGWQPKVAEPSGIAVLRSPLLEALGRFGDTAVLAQARKIDGAPQAEPVETRRAAHLIAARNADPQTFDAMVAALEAVRDPLDKQHLFEALCGVADPVLASRVLDLIIGPQAPAGSTPNLLVALAAEHPDLSWAFIRTHLDDPTVMPDMQARMAFVPLIPQASQDLARVAELQDYAAAHLPAAATRLVQASAAQIEQNAGFAKDGLPSINAWLRAR